MRNWPGFTIVELTAVLLIMALLAGATVYAFSAELRSARLEDAAAMVRDLDQMTRRHARASGTAPVMVLSPEEGLLRRREGEDRFSHTVRLPSPITIDEVLIGGGTALRSRDIEIPCSAEGRTPSYAVRLSGPRQPEPTWILVAGLTGQVIETTDETWVRDTLARTSGPAEGHDPD